MLIFLNIGLSLILMLLFIGAYILVEKVRGSRIFFSLKVYDYIKNIFEGLVYGIFTIIFQLILNAIQPMSRLPVFVIAGSILLLVRNSIVGIFTLFIPLIYYLVGYDISWNFYIVISLMILMFLSGQIIRFFIQDFLVNMMLINIFMFLGFLSVITYDLWINRHLTTDSIEIIFMPFMSLMIIYYGLASAIKFLISANILYKSVNFNFSRYYRQSLKEVAIGEFIHENRVKRGIYGIFELNYKKVKTLEQNLEIRESILLDLESVFPKNSVLFRADEKRYGFFLPIKQKISFQISFEGNNLVSRHDHDLLKRLENLIHKSSVTYITSWKEKIAVKIRVGVAIYGLQSSSITTLQNLADFALQNEQSNQKNLIQLFNPSNYFVSLRETKLINDMDAKIKLDNFINYYTPIFDTKKGRTIFYLVTSEKVEDSEIKETVRDFINFFEWTAIFDRYMAFWALKNIFKNSDKTQKIAKIAFYYSPTIIADQTFNIDNFVLRLNHTKTQIHHLILIFDYYMFKQVKNYEHFFKNLEILRSKGLEIGVIKLWQFPLTDLEKLAPNYCFIENHDINADFVVWREQIRPQIQLVAFDIKSRQEFKKVTNAKINLIGGEWFQKSSTINNLTKQSKMYIYRQIKSRGELND